MFFHYIYPAQSHYVPAEIWRELLARLQHSLAHPDPNAQFRGSLIDELMFAIDVNEWELPNLLEQTRTKRLAEIEAIEKRFCENKAGGQAA